MRGGIAPLGQPCADAHAAWPLCSFFQDFASQWLHSPSCASVSWCCTAWGECSFSEQISFLSVIFLGISPLFVCFCFLFPAQRLSSFFTTMACLYISFGGFCTCRIFFWQNCCLFALDLGGAFLWWMIEMHFDSISFSYGCMVVCGFGCS